MSAPSSLSTTHVQYYVSNILLYLSVRPSFAHAVSGVSGADEQQKTKFGLTYFERRQLNYFENWPIDVALAEHGLAQNDYVKTIGHSASEKSNNISMSQYSKKKGKIKKSFLNILTEGINLIPTVMNFYPEVFGMR